MFKFIVDRKTWFRGRGREASRLLLRAEDGGGRCCLGFLGKACGFPDAELRDIGMPLNTRNTDWWPKGILEPGRTFPAGPGYMGNVKCTDTTMAISHVNDSEQLDDTMREHELKSLFAKLDIEVEFV